MSWGGGRRQNKILESEGTYINYLQMRTGNITLLLKKKKKLGKKKKQTQTSYKPSIRTQK